VTSMRISNGMKTSSMGLDLYGQIRGLSITLPCLPPPGERGIEGSL
jgi:hypothetical protein